jgi:nitrogenase delta subunit
MPKQQTQQPETVLMDEEKVVEYREQLLDHILKKCLWQFHSRAWDRERQNENIVAMTTKLLCGEELIAETPEDRCYYVDAFDLARSYRIRFAWLADLSTEQIKQVMASLKERLDFLLITGSLNAELTDTHY